MVNELLELLNGVPNDFLVEVAGNVLMKHCELPKNFGKITQVSLINNVMIREGMHIFHFGVDVTEAEVHPFTILDEHLVELLFSVIKVDQNRLLDPIQGIESSRFQSFYLL